MDCSAPSWTSSGSAVARRAFWSCTTNSPAHWAAARLPETSGYAAKLITRSPPSRTSGASSCESGSRAALTDAARHAGPLVGFLLAPQKTGKSPLAEGAAKPRRVVRLVTRSQPRATADARSAALTHEQPSDHAGD